VIGVGRKPKIQEGEAKSDREIQSETQKVSQSEVRYAQAKWAEPVENLEKSSHATKERYQNEKGGRVRKCSHLRSEDLFEVQSPEKFKNKNQENKVRRKSTRERGLKCAWRGKPSGLDWRRVAWYKFRLIWGRRRITCTAKSGGNKIPEVSRGS